MSIKQYKFTNPKTKKTEMVDLERWIWGVIYDDGKELHQFDADGNFHWLAEIDQSRVKLFVMYKSDESGKRFDIVMPEGARIIHKYKNIRPYYMNKWVRVYMFGYRTGKSEKDFEYHYHWILPNDRVVISNKDNVDLTKFELGR